jgi:glutathione synthase/RimK-type ligase-like ATP-grasp enzyme
LVGIDVIDGNLTEINVTSPTGNASGPMTKAASKKITSRHLENVERPEGSARPTLGRWMASE